MSNQSNSSVYNEKKIAAYEALFKESAFAKPQEVYLTVTVAHLFGQAYIMEQQGTKEGDPIYSRFVLPLEEITNVYNNLEQVKSPDQASLFIVCDRDVKGVVYRKRVIIPCLKDVKNITDQINEIRAARMDKVNAALEREKQRKLREIENQRKEEQAALMVDAAIPPLASVKKLPDPVPVKVSAAPTPVHEKTDLKNVKALNNEIAESIKALEGFEKDFSKNKSAAKTSASVLKKPTLDLDSIPDKVIAAPKTIPTPIKEEVPVQKPAPAPVQTEAPIQKPAPTPVQTEAPVQKPAPTPVQTEAPVQKPAPTPVQTEAPVQKPAPDTIKTAAPRVNPNGKPSALSDFEAEVKKLKALKDSGQITAEEYTARKKKLVAELY